MSLELIHDTKMGSDNAADLPYMTVSEATQRNAANVVADTVISSTNTAVQVDRLLSLVSQAAEDTNVRKTVPKTGFETAIEISSSDRYVRVAALGASGSTLGVTGLADVQTGAIS